MPQDEAILALVSQDGTTVTFEATYEGKKNQNPYDLWVRCVGKDSNGVVQGVSDGGLRWNEQQTVAAGDTCQLTLSKPAGVEFTAFVWLFPNFNSAVSNTLSF